MLQTMTLLITALFLPSWIYAIVAAQVSYGFPPFYIHLKKENRSSGYDDRLNLISRSSIYLLPLSLVVFSAGILIDFQIVTLFSSLIGAASAFLFGFRHRQFLKAEPNLPYPLIDMMRFLLPILGEITNRYPMLIFEIWTIGIASLFFMMMVIS
ncbi:MAG: hypothetical protein AAF681_12380 [Pseudomonadota bacterium]